MFSDERGENFIPNISNTAKFQNQALVNLSIDSYRAIESEYYINSSSVKRPLNEQKRKLIASFLKDKKPEEAKPF